MFCFADVELTSPEKLATAGTPYVLAVCLLAVATALVWVYRTYRSDTQAMQAKHEVENKEQRAEFLQAIERVVTRHDAERRETRSEHSAALGKITEAVQAVAAEARAATAESRAATATILARLDRLEDHIDAPSTR